MSDKCPTCSHMLNGIGYGMAHCPRCGTLVGGLAADGSFTVPALVGRCRSFALVLSSETNLDQLRDRWRMFGIDSAIRHPGDRT